MSLDVTFTDWLELLGLQSTIDELLAGQSSLTDARGRVEVARTSWPSVSQDFVPILDQLEPFFQDVADTIDEQHNLLADFNSAVSGFGPTFPIPDDRLLTQEDLEEIVEIRDGLFDMVLEQRSQVESLIDEIERLQDELQDLMGGMDEGDPFLADDLAEVMDRLDGLQDALEGEGCV
jgi:hypothetical protein